MGEGATDDCDDHDPSTHPGAAELIGDLVDRDCDGVAGCSPISPGASQVGCLLCLVAVARRRLDRS